MRSSTPSATAQSQSLQHSARPLKRPHCRRALLGTAASFLVGLSACNSAYLSQNYPLLADNAAPDCRASLNITLPRGEKDVMVILCLSGGGSRAAWFSAAAMLRLEQVTDQVNLLHEVDVISSVSGSSLTAAYYCVSRDATPYAVVRVRRLPANLPAELASIIQIDPSRNLMGIASKMTPEQKDRLLAMFDTAYDRECVERLYWLSHRTRAPEVWHSARVRELLTRNYTGEIVEASFSPLNAWDDVLYWTTHYNRSDQMAKIFAQNIFGAKSIPVRPELRHIPNLELLGYLDRPVTSGQSPVSPVEQDRVLRYPPASTVDAPVQIDWIAGYSPPPPRSQNAPTPAPEQSAKGTRPATAPVLKFVPYRFKDLNPERPYLVMNSTSATEDDPQGLRFGEIFTFTREDFATHLNSAIDNYDLAHGVMASAAFPGAFSFVNLRDFRPATPDAGARYLHVFDGGTVDNMGLTTAKKIILAHRERYRHFVVLMVDSHTPFVGASRAKADPRGHVVDLNFMHSFETLLDSVRKRELDEFNSHVLDGQDFNGKLTFWHITYDDLRDPQLRQKANDIPTLFHVKADEIETLDKAAGELIRPDHPKLLEFLRVLRAEPNLASAGD